ncbi:glycoside hydrolase family 3 protein [Hyaloscypha bicolor E]|uniref:Probable beta-glucosidase G n=1 Tax=Hyaloscypha bicolor E TaxID=1095630 RepID=A0A2J6TF65_9HELO|nr:glycoside hydrolase family 3 protein [Hyaloscypha bicolor E]PMD61671.1 glycoside hydrolase family 3 protein [Hyaloscypha bicolor E]
MSSSNMKSLSISIVIGAFSPIINAALAPAATGLSYVVPPPSSNGGKYLFAEFMVTGQAGPCAGNSGNITRLGIPKMCFQDGPAGVRPALGHTQFPSSLTTAATWDVELMYNRSYAMGKEYADPYGTGTASWCGVKGMMDSGVQSCSKHYTVYEQETYRNPLNFTEPYSIYNASQQLPISSNVDDKTNHEIYLWSFAEAVRAGKTHVMCAYNSINGTHACANSESNNGALKGELNFQGALISDWGGTWGTEGFVMGGLDVNMPGLGYGNILGPFYDQELLKMVENGTISETRLDDMVVCVVTPLISTGQLDNPLPSTVINSVGIANWPVPVTYRNVQQESTVELIRKISADGTILLKNTGGLPLKAPQNIAVIGQDAGPNILGLQGCGKLFRDCGILNNNGTLSMGGGSGYAWPQNLITPLEAIQTKALDSRSLVQFVLQNTATSVIAETITGSALPIGQPDVCLVFAERYMRENMDRNDLGLNIANWTHSEDIILQTAASCNNTIVVLHVGGPVIMEAWIDHPNITAVVAPLFPGEQTGPGLVDVLWGHVSPSGKLPFTIGKSESDYPPNTISYDHSISPQSNFTEKLKIDYRWFDTYNITPRFEFGFGLTYSTFEYCNISLANTPSADALAIQETKETFVNQTAGESIYDILVTVSARVKNTGDWAASEVAQLYVEFPAIEDQPPKALRGFTKLKDMAPGSGYANLGVSIRRKDVMVWDVVLQKWRLPQGSVKFLVGASSRILPLVSCAFPAVECYLC